MERIELLQKKIDREIQARKQAESILETKALELFKVNEQLKKLNTTKDQLLDAVSKALKVLFQYEDLTMALKSSLNILGPKANAERISIIRFKNNSDVLEIRDNFEWSGNKVSSILKKINSKKAYQSKFLNFCDHQFTLKDSKYIESDRIVSNELTYLDIDTAVIYPIYDGIKLTALLIFELLDPNDLNSVPFQSVLGAFSAGIRSVFERNIYKERIDDQKKFYESILNSIPNDLVVFNPDHQYTFINPVAVKNSEIRKWMIGKDDFEYVEYRNLPKEVAEKRRSVFNKVKNTQRAEFFEEQHVNPKGEVEWKHRILYPVLNQKKSEIEMVIGYAIDITDIKKTQQEKESISSRLSTLITSLNSGVLLEDENRNILVTNEDFCSMFEIPATPDQLIGIDCSNSAEESKHLISNPDEFVSRINKIISERKICLNEEIKFKNGKIFERDFIPIYNNDIYLGHLWEYTDITSRKESEKLLIKAREEAEESKRLKQKFLANMSHEIRTPMNGVIGIVHLLERTELDSNQKKYLNILRDSSEHLLHIINDILDVSKIEEGKLQIVKSPIQLDIIIEGVIQNLKSRATDKKLALEAYGLDIFNSYLLADPVRIRQVMLNLLSNAIKFTHKGKVSINCKVIKENSSTLEFSISVNDSGIGIPQDRLPIIFDAFDQISLDTTAQYGGTGLGLNIVRDLVEKMDGKIKVESEEGVGSSFILELKLKKTKKPVSVFENNNFNLASKDSLNGYTILVADDHSVNFTIAKEIISAWGATIKYAEDGEIALTKVLEDKIDLVLMDMQMPNMDGIDATKMIRLLEKPKSDIPIIAMTAAALPEEREKCLQSGMNDYISKPYSPSMLYDILTNYLLKKDSIRNDSVQEKKKIGTYDFNLDYLRELSGNSITFIEEMISAFQKDTPEIISELFLCVKNEDYTRISELAHKSKSMASYMGSDNLRKVFVEIEHLADTKENIVDIKEAIDKAKLISNNIIEELNRVEL